MKKLILSMVLAVGAFFGATAQMPQLTPLPLNEDVKTGVLPNGLTYYVLHNAEPKERANFYIAQKVGSTLEEESQLGLAHFLEHMAFNGSTNYPGKSMLNYLQSKGLRFGSDINAYTSFDETVYRINNVPTTDRPLMDSVLLVLRDWSDGIALEEAEIEAERGVINEEWRQTQDVYRRQYETVLPQIFQEYQYQQMPIGKMEVVLNFAPDVLRAYYEKWYRPDQQGIIVVGDFDAAEMEQKVIKLFSTVEMPENAAPRVYPEVSDNQDPLYAVFSDKEFPYPSVRVCFKEDVTPREIRNTVEIYANEYFVKPLIVNMVNERLSEATHDPNCAFAHAGVGFGPYMVAKTKDMFTINIIGKESLEEAYQQALGIVVEALKGGFTDSELERAKKAMLASYERNANEKDKFDSDAYGTELKDYFIDNVPAPGADIEYQLAQGILPNITVEMINMSTPPILTEENEVFIVSVPEGYPVPTKEFLVSTLREDMAKTYTAREEEKLTEPLIAKLPKKGKITSEKYNEKYDATELMLSNGVKVIVKKTDFKADEINIYAYRKGGLSCYPTSEAVNLQFSGEAFDCSNVGPYDPAKLRKYLAGKKVSLSYVMGNYFESLVATTTVKDLPDQMELLYAELTQTTPNQQNFDATLSQIRTNMKNQDKNPQWIFSSNVLKTLYGDNPMQNALTLSSLDQLDYLKSRAIATNSFANAADYNYIFVGNVDVETLKPLLEQYVASLPSKKKAEEPKRITSLLPVTGQVSNVYDTETDKPAVDVYCQIGGDNVPYTLRNSILVDFMGQLLDMNYLETLREEIGGTYGAGVGASLSPWTGLWSMYFMYRTAPDKEKVMIERANLELNNLLQNGANPDHFNKIKTQAIKGIEVEKRTNEYWMNAIFSYENGIDTFTDIENILESITIEEVNALMKNIYDGKNRVFVQQNGIPKEK
ncbi:MAG: insulinase family protein [Bacteroides sp.]|nr:insulinase family protein [Bacteroides sp.]